MIYVTLVTHSRRPAFSLSFQFRTLPLSPVSCASHTVAAPLAAIMFTPTYSDAANDDRGISNSFLFSALYPSRSTQPSFTLGLRLCRTHINLLLSSLGVQESQCHIYEKKKTKGQSRQASTIRNTGTFIVHSILRGYTG